MLSSIYLVGEDEPTLAIGRKLVGETPRLSIYREENGGGYGALKKKTPNYQQMGSRGLPVLMITDLDRSPCPPKLISDWLGQKPSPGFLFRICVREVEAWLLADRESIAAFLKISPQAITTLPEQLSDPKAELIRLAQKAPRVLRVGLTPVGSATIGPDYNSILTAFIRDSWSPKCAALNSPSLVRTRRRLSELAAMITSQA